MADGSIVIDVDLGTDNALKELNRLKNAMTKTETEMSKNKFFADNLKQQIEDAKARIEDLRSQYTESMAVGIVDQKVGDELDRELRALRELEEKYASIQGKIKGQSEDLAASKSVIDNLTEKVGEQEQNESDVEEEVEDTNRALDEQAKKVAEVNSSSKETPGIFEKLKGKLFSMAKQLFVFSMFRKLLQSVRSSIGSMVGKNAELSASLAQLRGAFATMVAPIISSVIPVLTRLIQIITTVIAKIAAFISALFGMSINKSKQLAKSIGGVGSAAKKASKQLAAFDEIQKLTDDSSDGGGGAGGDGLDFGFDVENIEFLDAIAEKLRRIWDVLKEAFRNFYTDMIEPLIGPLEELWALIKEKVLDALENVATWMEEHQEEVNQWVEIVGSIAIVAGLVAAAIGLITGAVKLLTLALNTPLVLFGLIVGVLAALVVAFGHGDEAIQLFKDIFSDMVAFVTALINGDWKEVGRTFYNLFADSVNLLLIALDSVADAIAALVNWGIDQINKLGFNIGHIGGDKLFALYGKRVPKLAEGAVIPPNREFLAVLGDQKSGTNIETPLATMIEAFNAALDSRGNSGNSTIILEVDGTQFGKVVYNANRRESKRVGVKLAEVTG